jgi:hypothetical protein
VERATLFCPEFLSASLQSEDPGEVPPNQVAGLRRKESSAGESQDLR